MHPAGIEGDAEPTYVRPLVDVEIEIVEGVPKVAAAAVLFAEQPSDTANAIVSLFAPLVPVRLTEMLPAAAPHVAGREPAVRIQPAEVLVPRWALSLLAHCDSTLGVPSALNPAPGVVSVTAVEQDPAGKLWYQKAELTHGPLVPSTRTQSPAVPVMADSTPLASFAAPLPVARRSNCPVVPENTTASPSTEVDVLVAALLPSATADHEFGEVQRYRFCPAATSVRKYVSPTAHSAAGAPLAVRFGAVLAANEKLLAPV